MIHSHSRTIITWGFILAAALLVLSALPAAAQTNTGLRPAAPAISDGEAPLPEREEERLRLREHTEDIDAAGVPIRAEEREHIELKEREERDDDERVDAAGVVRPESFLEKARNVLLERRAERVEPEERDEVREVRLQNATGRDGRIEEATERREERLEETEERREEHRVALEANKEARIAGYLDNVSRKMSAAIERLNVLGDRIESRIEKIEEAGYDMTDARALLETAREKITEADTETATALDDAKTALSEDMTRETFGAIASTLAHAKENLREAHQALVEVIRNMKASIEREMETETETEDETSTDEETSTGGTTSTPTAPGGVQ